MCNDPLFKCANCNQVPKDPEELERNGECHKCQLIDIVEEMFEDARYGEEY